MVDTCRRLIDHCFTAFDECQQVVVLIATDRSTPAEVFAKEPVSFKRGTANGQIRAGSDASKVDSREPIFLQTIEGNNIVRWIEVGTGKEKRRWCATEFEDRPHDRAYVWTRESAHERFQPTHIHERVVISECDDVSARMSNAYVSRPRGTSRLVRIRRAPDETATLLTALASAEALSMTMISSSAVIA